MRPIHKLLFLLCCVLTSATALAQKKTFTGKITDAVTGIPLEGVAVKLKSTGKGIYTDKQGQFALDANPGDVLQVSYVGYTNHNFSLKENETALNLNLQPVYSDLEQVVLIGTRGVPRAKTETAVPVDVIAVGQNSLSTARPDLSSQLNMTVPSFNYNRQSGGDGSDAIDFASLRGLGFDHTLVLVNGKRRHMSAIVNQGGTRGRGNSGTDLNSIPEATIDRIEILRDGASAQYGSDAIAGVMNIILKKSVNKLSVNAGYSGYYDHKYNSRNAVDPSQFYTGTPIDGNTVTLGMDYGLRIGKHDGFINFGGNFLTQGKTFRAEPDTNMSVNSKALTPNTWRRAFGEGAVTSGGGMVNAEIPVAGTSTKFYFFGGYNYKHSNVYAWTRNFAKNPEKFPTDNAGNLVFVPGIMRIASTGDGNIGPANVYYNPQEDVYIKDASFAAGFNGTAFGSWDWDISNVVGYNDFHYHGGKTFNASLMPETLQPTRNSFDDGGFSFLQNTANLDVSRHFDGVGSGLTLSFGGEFRYEKYKLYKGEEDSYKNGGAYFVSGGDTTYKASGSEGFPGFQPGDETNKHRTNVGGYADVAIDITRQWLVDAAARFENYSDFGFVNTYKLASRYKVTHNFNIRGAVSTGFRAPTLQQINFSNTNTTIVKGELVYTKLVPNYSPITKAAGIPDLKQEKSVNGSLGFTWQPVKSLTFTVDGYWVKVKDRIVMTGNFDATIPEIAPFLESNVPPVGSVNFFANAVNTTNKGIDVVVDYVKHWGKNTFKVLLAGNVQTISIDKINVPGPFKDSYLHEQTFYSTREQAFLKASAPHEKFSLAIEYNPGKFTVGTHLTYWGKLTTQGYGYAGIPALAGTGGPGDPAISGAGLGYSPMVVTDDGKSVVPENFVFSGKVTTDVYISYKVSKNLVWYVGVDNLFNVHPDQSVVKNARNMSWGDSESGGPFDAVQMGFNGMRMFSKVAFNF